MIDLKSVTMVRAKTRLTLFTIELYSVNYEAKIQNKYV